MLTRAYWNNRLITQIDQYVTRYGVRSAYIHLQGIAGSIHVTLSDIYLSGKDPA